MTASRTHRSGANPAATGHNETVTSRPRTGRGLALLVAASLAVGGPPGVALAGAPVPAATGQVAHEQLTPLAAEQAWQHSTGAGVVVAVLDSGVDSEHPDLAGRVLPGWDYVDGSTDGREDPVGHGTTVASLIAGRGDPAIGLAPDATILPVRVLDEQNRYQRAATVADGVIRAVDQGAQVINLSLGGARDSSSLTDALAYAMARDVVVVACTGNDTGDYAEVWYPAREPGVVAVSGLTFSRGGTAVRWPESLTGPETVLSAPAVLTGARAGGGRRPVQGTSFSSALVAATAALIRARWPDLPAAEVVNRLVSTATQLGAPGRDPVFGFGGVDPVAALTEPVPPVRGDPLDTKARSRATGFGSAPDAAGSIAAPEPASAGPEQPERQPAGGAGDEVRAAGDRTLPGLIWALLAFTVLLLAAAATRPLIRR
ncbi:MAG: type VII secretion-associated serine protease mycosin [Micromonosporaceae bacterium]|nr:type VII secretion-associated serine protease mycosin [Micromonosporaceae bacterium]